MNSVTVGPYRIIRVLNEGGQGSVYLGYDERLQRRVAIKIYRLPSARTERKRLLREAQIVAALDSPKIVQVHDVIESPEHLAMVMEYVPGTDLEQFLAAVRPSLASVLTVASDVAAALAVARQQQIVHGDLKASNILISVAGRAKLTDFGIAHRADDAATVTGGSISALSPEQVLAKPLDVRSDLFALGILLYRMLTGQHPFMRAGELDVQLLLVGEPVPLSTRVRAEMGVPPSLLNLVTDLLRKNPADRPRNTHQVRRVLHEVSRGIPLAATNNLRREASALFRPESGLEVPPVVPDELGRSGRSRHLTGSTPDWSPGHLMALLSWPVRGALILAAVAAVGIPLFFALQQGPRPVYFEEPVIKYAAEIKLPQEISPRWLSAQVIRGVTAELGAVHVLGWVQEAHPQVIYADGDPALNGLVPEHVSIDMRCAESLCVVALSRQQQGVYHTSQAMLLPDMPVGQWRDVLHRTAAELYRR